MKLESNPVVESSQLPERIDDIDEVRHYIDAIDFAKMRRKLAEPDIGEPWQKAKIEFCEREYRRWLFLLRKYQGERLSPTRAMDEYWHAHILDTRGYMHDCARIFGHYVHHNPYFGMAGADPDERRQLLETADKTERYYTATFHEELYDIDNDEPPR